MVSTQFISIFILTWSMCVQPTEAIWKRHRDYHDSTYGIHVHHRKRQNSGAFLSNATLPANATLPGTYLLTAASVSNNTSAPSINLISSVPSTNTHGPSLTSQGMVVAATIPVYAMCINVSGASSQSCSTIHETFTTSSCSAVITAGFDTYTISECDQSITFSTRSTNSIVTLVASPTSIPVLKNHQADCPSTLQTTYVQNIVSYHVAPWRSLANNDPSSITVVIFKTDFDGQVSCETIKEVWIVHTEYVPVTMTRTVSVSQFFQRPAVLYFGPGQSMSVSSGYVEFHTEVLYSSMSAQLTTSTSQLTAVAAGAAAASLSQTPETPTSTLTLTSTLTSTSTIIVTGTTVAFFTTTADVLSVEPTTTLTSTETITSTTTVYPSTQ